MPYHSVCLSIISGTYIPHNNGAISLPFPLPLPSIHLFCLLSPPFLCLSCRQAALLKLAKEPRGAL